MKKFLFIFLVSFSLACSEADLEKSKIKVNLADSQKGNFSDLFSEINYLLLDMGEKEVLVRPFHILFTKDRIIVEDRDLANIHIFDKSGKLQSTIRSSNSGGPREIKQTEYIQVKEGKIHVNDISLGKTLTFDLAGKFIAEKKESIRSDVFHYFDQERVLYLGLKENSNQKIFVRESLAEGDTTTFYKFPVAYDWMGITTKDGFMKDEYSKSVFFNIPYSYEVIEFDQTGNIINEIEFDLGSYGITHADRYKQAESRNLNKYLGENGLINTVSSFFPMKNYFFMHLYQNNDGGKPSNHFLVFNRQFNLKYQTVNPKNDFDGMIMGVPWTYHEDKIYVILNSVSFYNRYIELYAGQKITVTPGSIHEFFQLNQEKLKDDQTVLVSLKLRADL